MVIAARPTFRTDAFIDGAFRPAAERRAFATENPATGRLLAEVAAGDAADIDAAVRSARAAFDDGRWSRRSPAERKAVLLRLADLHRSQRRGAGAARFARGRQADHRLSRGRPARRRSRRSAGTPRRSTRCSTRSRRPAATRSGMIVREPIGVVGAVLPWNFPLMMAAWKVAPALDRRQHRGRQAGRADLARRRSGWPSWPPRPASRTASSTSSPGSARRPARRSAGTWTSTWCRSPARPRSGGYFLRYSSESNLKQIVLECGGKSPQVVMADAPDLDLVAEQRRLRRLREHGRELHLRLAADRPSRRCATSCSSGSSPRRPTGRSATRRTRRRRSAR